MPTQFTTGDTYVGKSKFTYQYILNQQLMTKDRLCKLSEYLGSSKAWPLVLSILLRGLSGGRRVRRQWSGDDNCRKS